MTDGGYFSHALAALGAALQGSPYRVALWLHANRTLTATLAINNRRLRELKAHIAWPLIETAAVMSSDLVLWRRANIARGFPETVASITRIMNGKKLI
ncbi:uncharacterized protein PV06_09295 [Exophiala oligosperma]|uniref:Uncharacterized protein n=1 Tax=Exophiala oligosperma TaxID=215243 RepID=A0A0D2D7D4_9EURO|nr:uncharacterized protein PV06_09295 [Exophiala oligosperma]KIW38320.1 hypothetical protein PV06_09295 [Exophiala oligosperma]